MEYSKENSSEKSRYTDNSRHECNEIISNRNLTDWSRQNKNKPIDCFIHKPATHCISHLFHHTGSYICSR